MRVFVATGPDEGLRAHVSRFISACGKIRDVKWTLPMNLHLTLLFLGDVKEERMPWIEEQIRTAVAGIPPFSVRFDIKGVFSRRDSAILWAGASRAPDLEQLTGQIRGALREFDDGKPFKAHITVGRAKRRIDERAYEDVAWVPVDYPVRSVELIKSELFPEGPVYSRVAEFPLQA